MSQNRFNQYSSEGDENVTNGSLDIFGYSLRATNLNPSEPLKTNSINQLISSKLEIDDINNLQTELNATIQNPYNGGDLLITAGNLDALDVVTSGISSLNDFISNTEGNILNLQDGVADLQTKAQYQTASLNKTTFTGDVAVGTTSSLNTFIINTENGISNNANDILVLQNDKLEKDGSISMTGDLDLNNNSITNINNTQTESIGNSSGPFVINLADAVMNVNRPTGGNILIALNEVGNTPFYLRKSGTTDDICAEGSDELHFTTDCFVGIKKVILSPALNTMLLRDYSLDMNNNDVDNVSSMTITATRYLSKIADFGTPVGDLYIIPPNTTWIILGQITLEYGIGFSANCSLRGIDFSATITFDETSRDCVIKSVSENMYVSNLTIVGGGGRFTGNPSLVRGLFDAANYNTLAPAPFYGRNKRFKLTDCNIIRAYKIGTVEGYGTINITNNFFNGGGGLAGQPTEYYTNEGLSVSDGLSLEFNNNKIVLMLGAQQASSLKLLNMKSRISPLLGFNAVTITGNIFHPRDNETGIDFDPDSRTSLGNISGNVFIRTGGVAPLINYENQTLYDNYNPVSIENYSVNANTGVVDSEPNLKSAILNSVPTNFVNPTRAPIVPTFNDQIIKIDSSARFAIQLDCSGVTTPFVAFERIQYDDNPAFHNAYIVAVDPEAGGLQTIYVTDMNSTPPQIPNPISGWTSATGSCTSALYRYRWRYCEKDPRKLVTVATFTVATGNNEQYYVAPGNGVADVACEVSGIANASGVGGTVSLSCTRRFNDGDIVNFFVSSGNGSSTSIVKGIITIK